MRPVGRLYKNLRRRLHAVCAVICERNSGEVCGVRRGAAVGGVGQKYTRYAETNSLLTFVIQFNYF
jgi:hypothetical protein